MTVLRISATMSAWVLVCFLAFAATATASGVDEPQGYRMKDYMSPVPETLKGATTLDAEAVHKKITAGEHIVLIDVLPLRRKPPDFPPNRLWLTPPRDNIPDSVWLPNVGYGNIAPEFETYFKDNLQRLASDKRAGRPPELIFYCLANCWMSWNAAKRALELGHDKVSWFPGGTDEWEVSGFDLERSSPVKMPDFVPLDKPAGSKDKQDGDGAAG